MYGCESWTIKKAESQINDTFKQWCWRRLLRVPWTARSSKSILKEISPDYSQEGLMLKLNEVPVLWLPEAKNWLIWKDPDAGKYWRREDRVWDGWMESPTWWTWIWAGSGSWWCKGKPGELQSMRVAKSQLLSDWTDWTEKEWNDAICSYMNGPRNYHANWSKTEKDK